MADKPSVRGKITDIYSWELLFNRSFLPIYATHPLFENCHRGLILKLPIIDVHIFVIVLNVCACMLFRI